MRIICFQKIMTYRHIITFSVINVILALVPSLSLAKDPDCTGVNRWPTSMAFTLLKNAGVVDNRSIIFDKTKTIRLTSEKIGNDNYRQIHHITFIEKSGNMVEVITSSEASSEECSMGGVDVFVISQHLVN